jgi:hypothetical protein
METSPSISSFIYRGLSSSKSGRTAKAGQHATELGISVE